VWPLLPTWGERACLPLLLLPVSRLEMGCCQLPAAAAGMLTAPLATSVADAGEAAEAAQEVLLSLLLPPLLLLVQCDCRASQPPPFHQLPAAEAAYPD
jgi:hypothetical protein